MITGVETAGLVLAAFPLLISALEHYRQGFETLGDWWKFRTEFLAFIHVIERQSILFTENLEELLSPIITSDGEMGVLLQDPLGTAWGNSELEDKLKDRLPKSYEIYRDTIEDMKACMDTLEKKLSIKDGELTWVNDDSSPAKNRVRCEYEFRRIKYVLSKKKREKLLKTLTANNEELQKLFTSSERLADHRKRRHTPGIFKRIRDQACGLYSVLATGWRCNCPDQTPLVPPHHANLLLEKRTEGSKKFTKNTDQKDHHLRVLFRLETERIDWHQTEIRLLETDCQTLHKSTAGSQRADSAEVGRLFEKNAVGLPLSSRKSPKKVSFPQTIITPMPSNAPKSSTADLIEIADLCTAVQKACNGNAHLPLGFLTDFSNQRHAFYPAALPAILSGSAKTVTLASLISATGNSGNNPPKLRRSDRYTIAVTLASSLLQLYSSPWIQETWSKEDIYFLDCQQGGQQSIMLDKPYVSRKFKSYSADTKTALDQPAQQKDSSKSLQALGIMLLELCFGKAIEDHPIRETYLGRDGQPNDITDFATAKHWLDNEALGEAGQQYYDATRRCLLCAFGPKSTNLEDDKLRAAVYSDVVEPLEETVRLFTSTA